MKYGIVSNIKRDVDLKVAMRTKDLMESLGAEVVIEPSPDDPVGVIISIGGDGTFLSVIHKYLNSGCEFVGINKGSVGFLTSINEKDIDRDIPKLIKGEYDLIERNTLKVELLTKPGIQKLQISVLMTLSYAAETGLMLLILIFPSTAIRSRPSEVTALSLRQRPDLRHIRWLQVVPS